MKMLYCKFSEYKLNIIIKLFKVILYKFGGDKYQFIFFFVKVYFYFLDLEIKYMNLYIQRLNI